MVQQRLFGKKKEVEHRPDPATIEAVRRSRMLEERYHTLERRVQLIEENQIAHNRKFSSEIREINDELSGLRKSVSDINEKIGMIVAEMQNFARKENVQVIKKYLDYWDPLSFVTQKQAEKIVGEMLEERKRAKT